MQNVANNLVQPNINVLTEVQIDQIHNYSLTILSKTGVQVDSDRAIQVLASHSGVSVSQSNRVTFQPEVVERAIQTAPSHIDVHNRLGEYVFRLGEDRTRFGIGATTLNYLDPISGEISPISRKHMKKMVRLGHTLPYYDVVSTLGVLQDISARTADLYATLEMVANTTKPLVILVSDESRFSPVLHMLEHLTGDLAAKPFILPYFNPIAPLVVNRGTIDKMFVSIERGIPFIYNSYGLAGVTTPITAAGILTQLNAEILAGLTISQLIKEGTPICLGMLPAYFDMQNLVHFYDPSSYLINLACAEILAHYRIPHSGTSGNAMGWGADFMAADSYWLNHITALMSKVALAPFVGNTMYGKVFSPVNVLFAHEIIKQALKFSSGFQLDDAAVGLSDILERGQGGDFLSTRLTRKHVRSAYYIPDMYPRISFEKWQALGQPDAMVLLKEYTCELLETLSVPSDHQELINKGEAFIHSVTG